jgi:hypothetical protein
MFQKYQHVTRTGNSTQYVPYDELAVEQEKAEAPFEDDANTSFQFPLLATDERLDQSLSNSFNHDKNFRSPTKRRSFTTKQKSDAASFPYDFAIDLSPIEKSRESDASETGKECIPVIVPDRSRACEKDLGTLKDSEGLSTEPVNSSISHASPSASVRSVTERLSPVFETSNASVLDDLQSARKQVGESSIKFIDKIRNAAHKRKVAVTRSRDSLVAKENEQLRSIAESKARSECSEDNNLRPDDNENIPPPNHGNSGTYMTNPFRNRSRRSADGGFGGVGVPKVEKRPTTTPFSPLLGPRRRERVIVKALQKPKLMTAKGTVKKSKPGRSSNVNRGQANALSSRTEGKYVRLSSSNLVSDTAKEPEDFKVINSVPSTSTFKARPLPLSNGRTCHAGQVGVPKVPKRSVTIPLSPCLGPKRLSKNASHKSNFTSGSAESTCANVAVTFETTSRVSNGSFSSKPRIRKTDSASTIESSELLGLVLIDASPDEKGGHEVTSSEQNLTPQNATIKPFEPRSTCRANKRAEYDAIRDEHRQQRLEGEQRRLREQIKLIHKELAVMSKELT